MFAPARASDPTPCAAPAPPRLPDIRRPWYPTRSAPPGSPESPGAEACDRAARRRRGDAGALAGTAGDQPLTRELGIRSLHGADRALPTRGHSPYRRKRVACTEAAVDDLLPDQFGYLEVERGPVKIAHGELVIHHARRFAKCHDSFGKPTSNRDRELARQISGLLYRLVYSPQSDILIGIQCDWLSSRWLGNIATRARTPFTRTDRRTMAITSQQTTQSNPVYLRFQATKTPNASSKRRG